ncbi:TRAF2 and NCK-interacting protein kinase [Armadillidium nasatum]|uniref:TRAF2 and NCK-interacting protein kinase n=1 Tax=Armadillidium nasatum TaxID=96803 RepID=A0A5N5TAF0_9CRUS|nr:TRAF2 and NCK-interacting protein kinase [Armadillidium nasatum]
MLSTILLLERYLDDRSKFVNDNSKISGILFYNLSTNCRSELPGRRGGHSKMSYMGCRVAIKVMENIGENLEEIEEEFLVLRDLSIHPNLPTFYGIFLKRGHKQEEDQAWLVIELCSRGSVTDLVQALLRRNQKLSEMQIAYIIKETVYGLIYLHENHCMHRDIKGHNILLTESGDVKLVDFGVSSHLASTWGRRNTSVGTPYWMAPELRYCQELCIRLMEFVLTWHHFTHLGNRL